MNVSKREVSDLLIKVCRVFDVVMEKTGHLSDEKYRNAMYDLESTIYQFKEMVSSSTFEDEQAIIGTDYSLSTHSGVVVGLCSIKLTDLDHWIHAQLLGDMATEFGDLAVKGARLCVSGSFLDSDEKIATISKFSFGA